MSRFERGSSSFNPHKRSSSFPRNERPTSPFTAAIGKEQPYSKESNFRQPKERQYSASELLFHAENLSTVLGNFFDGVHRDETFRIQDSNLMHRGKSVDINNLETAIGRQRNAFLEINNRVVAKAYEVCPNLEKVFAPFNGAETIALASDHTIAIDSLPIGTPAQVDALYANPFAKVIYLVDKLDRGFSNSAVTQGIGYLGAALQWDIESIQGGIIENITYLDKAGEACTDPASFPLGIKITYTTQEGKRRIHEQYTYDKAEIPYPVKRQLEEAQFDGLYLRGTQNLLTKSKHFSEYQNYVRGVRSRGIIVSDSKIEDLLWRMEGFFSQREIVPLADDEHFGYAGKFAKITAARPDIAFQGHINILKRS